MTAWLIGFAHALPIILFGWLSWSRSLIWLVSTIMVVVAFAVGNIGYAIVDIICIAVATWIMLELARQKADGEWPTPMVKIKEEPVAPKVVPVPVSSSRPEGASAWPEVAILMILAVCYFVFVSLVGGSRSGSVNESASARPPVSESVRSSQLQSERRQSTVAAAKPKKGDLRHCLGLSSNEEIARCSAR